MKIEEILEGLEFRKGSLEEVIRVLEKERPESSLIEEYQVRLDEVESLHNWIKENST